VNVYFVSQVGSAFVLHSIPLGGGRATPLANIGSYPGKLAVDDSSIYFAIAQLGTISKVPKCGLPDGGAPTVLASGQNPGANGPVGIAVDKTNVYWTTYGAGGSVMKAPKGGGSPTTLASAQDAPLGIVVDGTHVYWTNQGSASNGAVLKVPIGGGVPTTLASREPSPGDIVVDTVNVYWSYAGTSLNGGVRKVPIGGGTPVGLWFGGKAALARGVAIDSTFIYWANYHANLGTVNRVPLDGGEIFTYTDYLKRGCPGAC
jgi:hypothetical protein